ncbi:MAG: hypothetical protein E7149_07160 [Rikenellaceae bacterium]|nr:hypothetical protein [Rikenellaceae bacterium]
MDRMMELDWQTWIVWAIGCLVGWLVLRAAVRRLWPLFTGQRTSVCEGCAGQCGQCTKIKEEERCRI